MATMTVEKWIEEIKGMSVLDLSNLVKALEEEFGVSAAAAPVANGTTGGMRRSTKNCCPMLHKLVVSQ